MIPAVYVLQCTTLGPYHPFVSFTLCPFCALSCVLPSTTKETKNERKYVCGVPGPLEEAKRLDPTSRQIELYLLSHNGPSWQMIRPIPSFPLSPLSLLPCPLISYRAVTWLVLLHQSSTSYLCSLSNPFG